MPVAAGPAAAALPLAAAIPIDGLSAAQRAAAPVATAMALPTTQPSAPLVLADAAPLTEEELRIRRAKLKARPMLFLHQWAARQYCRLPLHLNLPPPAQNIDVVDGRTLSVADFHRRYELPYRPALITGLCEGQGCAHRWTPSQLLEDFGDWRALVGRGEKKEQVRLALRHFGRYCETDGRTDDSPLYVFDPEFGEDSLGRRLLRDYAVPKYFREDLFKHAGSARPPYRWFLMGPPRSGSGVHTVTTPHLGSTLLRCLSERRALCSAVVRIRWRRPPGTPSRMAGSTGCSSTPPSPRRSSSPPSSCRTRRPSPGSAACCHG